jgi:hypothetical protein
MLNHLLNQTFYCGIIFDSSIDLRPDTIKEYIEIFIDPDTEKYCEYKVKIVDIYNNPADGDLYYKLEIISVISDKIKSNVKSNVKNNVKNISGKNVPGKNIPGKTIHAWANRSFCDKELGTLPYNPEFDINDGGIINCNYTYCSLLIPWVDYVNILKPKPVKIRGCKVRIEIKCYKQDNTKIIKKLRNINLCDRELKNYESEDYESEDYESENNESENKTSSQFDEKSRFEQDGIYHLYSMCKKYGYIVNSKFIKLENKDLDMIAHFFSHRIF